VLVAIYAATDPGGKRFLSTLAGRLDREEIRAWVIKRRQPLTLVHAGDRYTKIRVTFTTAGPRGLPGAAKAGLGEFKHPEPEIVANISAGASSDRVLGFLVGMLTRHAAPLGVTGVGIPLEG
jgi:hypothetical protein